MKSQALQDLVKRIFSDEKTKRQFMSNPEGVLAQFNLTEQEKKAVAAYYASVSFMDTQVGKVLNTLNLSYLRNMTWDLLLRIVIRIC